MIELDAAIMDGRTRDAGAVAGVRDDPRPISLARAVMEQSPHVFLSFEGADQFAREQGFEQVDNGWFATAERRAPARRAARQAAAFDADVKYGTVGAVAVDAAGHVAAATSTGGLTAKRWGRIGDSPLIGAGTYADDRAAAVSATGSGEYFIRAGRRARGRRADAAWRRRRCRQALDEVLADIEALGGNGGLIAVAPVGRGGLGLHHAAACIAASPTPDGRQRRDLCRDDGAVGQGLAQPVDLRRRSPAARRRGNRRPRGESRDRG